MEGPQPRPLGCAGGLRRPVLPLQLPGSARLGGNATCCRRCVNRRLGSRCAAIGWSEALSGGWAEHDPTPLVTGPAGRDAQVARAVAAAGPSQPHHDSPSHHSHARQHHAYSHLDPQQLHHKQHNHQQQRRHEAAQQVAQRLMPPTPVASATHLPARSGISAGGVALGVLLTVALQLVGRWLTRQAWGRALLELLDLRRNSGRAASTSSGDGDGGMGSSSSGAAAAAATGSSSGGGGGGKAGGVDGTVAAAAAVGAMPFAGTSPGSPLVSLDGVGSLPQPPGAAGAGGVAMVPAAAGTGALPVGADPGESVEWVNMCWRKVWRVYQRGLERWIIDLLQPVFDGLVKDGAVPRWLCRLRVVELTLDHEAPYFSNMRRRNSRKDSDLNGVVDLRYTGGARMLLLLELGEGRWRFKVPVLVSDLDLECQMWLKLRLAPMCPWIGTISLAFVGPPNVKVQLSPYNRVRLMRVPVVQNYLRKLLTVDLPGLMVLPQRLEINIPPSVTTIAEAAVGRDTIMRAVASAVLQADAVEAALLAALPLGPQTPAGGVTLPEAFKGELSVTLREARNLPVWGFPGQSNPYCRLVLGEQAVQSRREGDTSHPGRHRAPVWNQEFQFLVEDPQTQVLEMLVKDSHLTGRTEVGRASIRLADLLAAQSCAEGGKVAMWVPLQPPAASYGITGGEAVPTGEVLVELSYKPFDDDEQDSGCREAENYLKQAAAQSPITDIRSAAAASSRAAVAASAAVSAIAMTKAAAARAAARAARAAQEAAAAAAGAAKGAVDQGASMIGGGGGGGGQPSATKAAAALPPGREVKQLPPGAEVDAESNAAAAPLSAPAVGAHGGGDVQAAEAGDGLPSHTPMAAGSAQRARVLMLEDGRKDEGDDSDSGVGGGGGGSGVAVRPTARATERAASADGADAAVLMAALRAATATAVLERPAPLREREILIVGGGGGDGEGTSSVAHVGGNGGPPPAADITSAWREERVTAADGVEGSNGGHAGGGAMDHHATAPWRADTNGHDGADGAVAKASGQPPHAHAVRVTEVQVRVPQQEGQPAASSRSSPEGSVDVLDVPAEVVPPPPPPSATAAAVSQERPTGQSASGGGGGGGASVMSALASWTASAQSLTASAMDKARESLGQKPQGPHSSPQAQEKAKEQRGGGSGEVGGGGGADWLQAIVALLPRYGGGPGAANHQDESGGSGGERTDGSKAPGGAAKVKAGSAAAPAGDGGDDEHPWWQFWVPKGGAAKLREADGAADAAASAGAAEPPSAAADGGAANAEGGKPWWQFWGDSGGDTESGKARRAARKGAGRGGEAGPDGADEEQEEEEQNEGAKPVEAIYIPPDLPLEEIAAEVAKLKEDSWRERSDHVSNLWMKAVERNDRKWLMLAAFLLSVAVGLLTVVAWRLEQLEELEKLQAAAPQIALMSMQAALQALLQQTGGSDVSGLL